MLMAIMSYLALGAVAGALAGLYGVGGGLIIVPSLMAVFALQQVPAEISMHLAVGTSLASIVITGSSSALGHYRRGSIRRDWLVALLPGLVLGAIAESSWREPCPAACWERCLGCSCCWLR